jgi:REP element-mobilizing transposase RayT
MHSYNSIYMHCVFSTKERRPFITSDIRDRLYAYLGGTARALGMKAMALGGVSDHVHVLLSLPGTLGVAEALQKLKANSSRWIHETFPECQEFEWQKGYGAFSIGMSQAETTIAYIRRQEAHHLKWDFREEFAGFLQKHGIDPNLEH